MSWSPFSECWALSQLFHSPLSLSSRGSLVHLCFLPYGWCHLHYYSWKKVKVAQSYPTLRDPMDYRVHWILQAGILEWTAFPFSRGSSQPRDRTQVSHIAGGFFTSWATGEAHALAISNLKIYRRKTILSHQNSRENIYNKTHQKCVRPIWRKRYNFTEEHISSWMVFTIADSQQFNITSIFSNAIPIEYTVVVVVAVFTENQTGWF